MASRQLHTTLLLRQYSISIPTLRRDIPCCFWLPFQAFSDSDSAASFRSVTVKLIPSKESLEAVSGKGGRQRGTIELFQVIERRILGELTDTIRSKPPVVKLPSTWSCVCVLGTMHKDKVADMELLSFGPELFVLIIIYFVGPSRAFQIFGGPLFQQGSFIQLSHPSHQKVLSRFYFAFPIDNAPRLRREVHRQQAISPVNQFKCRVSSRSPYRHPIGPKHKWKVLVPLLRILAAILRQGVDYGVVPAF